MKKLLFYFLIIIFIILIFASCSKKPESLNIIGTWGGTELENFIEVCKASEININFETTRDLDALITTRIQSNNLPDIAILPNPAKLKELAKKGKIKELTFLDKKELETSYSNTWLDLANYGGSLYGIFYKAANKSVIWYNPEEFKKNGWEVPQTWDDLIALTNIIRESGKTPWSVGADVGWPLSDWIENIMIRTSGPDLYQDWIDHEIPWNHQAVKSSFNEWGKIVANPDNLFGGIDGTLSTSFQNGAFAVFQEKPECYMYFEGDFMGGIITNELDNLVMGKNIWFFPFPPINPEFKTPVVGGADVIVAFNDSKNVKKLLNFLITKEAHEIWVKKGGFISQNKKVSLDNYPDKSSRLSAEILSKADIYVFDASDLMPSAVGNQGGFWDACKKYIQNPENLDEILIEMEEIAKEHY